jgi:hypothetical protein
LLIVGGKDQMVIDLNEQAIRSLRCCTQLALLPGANHLFEEPGMLQKVGQLSRDWFTLHLQGLDRVECGRSKDELEGDEAQQ